MFAANNKRNDQRHSPGGILIKKVFLKNAANLQKNTLAGVWFQQHCNFFESTLQDGCHLVNLLLSISCLIMYFQNTFSQEHFWGTASKLCKQKLKYIKTCKLSYASLCNHNRSILLFIQKRVFRCLPKPSLFSSGQIS